MVSYEYRTETGRDLILRPVSALLIQGIQDTTDEELRTKGIVVDTPTYTVETVAGTVETFSHVVDVAAGVNTLTDPDPVKQAENERAWAKYMAGQQRLTEVRATRLNRLFSVEGIDLSKCKDYPDGEWVGRLQFMGVAVPTEPRARHYAYVQMIAFSGVDEMAKAANIVMQMTMTGVVDEGKVAAATRLFRRAPGGRAARSAGSDAGEVAALDDAGSVPGGESVASDA